MLITWFACGVVDCLLSLLDLIGVRGLILGLLGSWLEWVGDWCQILGFGFGVVFEFGLSFAGFGFRGFLCFAVGFVRVGVDII